MGRNLHRLTAAEQTAAFLRSEVQSGRWSDKLPGVPALARECDVSPATVRAALRLLEAEGRITACGNGRNRRVTAPGDSGQATAHPLRVAVLPGEKLNAEDVGFQNFLFRLQHDLESSGHVCVFAEKSQAELKHDTRRIAAQVAKTPADAWVVAGGEHATLEWFAAQPAPAIAIGGRCIGLPIASTGMSNLTAFRLGVRQLLELGHRRIVLLAPRFLWQPVPGPTVQALFGELASAGITATRYNVPDWDETPASLRKLLESIFHVTPPTALIVAHTNWMVAVLSFLARRGLQVPRDVSVLCMNHETWFDWHRPAISHLYGDERRMARRIVRWIAAVARGKADRDYVPFPLEFVPGESIGPAPKPRPHEGPSRVKAPGPPKANSPS